MRRESVPGRDNRTYLASGDMNGDNLLNGADIALFLECMN
jgi:hypothetical protein